MLDCNVISKQTEAFINDIVIISNRDNMTKDVKNTIIITVSTSKVNPLVTEPKYKKTAILRNGKGEIINLKSHQITRDMISFLESSGLSVEYGESPAGRRGRNEIAGIGVKVSPINTTNYDKGAIIKVPEEDDLDLSNTIKVLKYLRKGGVDIEKFCQTNEKGTSCIQKLIEKETL